MGFPLDRDINYFKYEIGRDGFSFAADFIWSFLASNPGPLPAFYALGLGRGAHYSSCVCGFVMGVVVSLRSSVQLQIRRCPRHGSLAGQRPEWQRLQLVRRGSGDERGGQRHLPGAQIVSLTAARAWITNSLRVTCSLTHQILCYTLNVESSCSFPQFCSPSFSLVERSQMAPTWWNRWDTVTWKVKCQHHACVFMPCGI